MLICSIDTSGRDGSLALAEGDTNSFAILHRAAISGGTYSAQLIPTLSGALLQSGRQKSDISLLAVASGPGSFTGLRVGLGTVKGLAEVLHVPVVAISVLEAIAFLANQGGLVITVLDAQRSEVFAGEFETGPQGLLRTVNEFLIPAVDFIAGLRERNLVPAVFTPDAKIATQLRDAQIPAQEVRRPAADDYARIALVKFLAGKTADIETLDANYLRRSDAEIFSAPKLGIPTEQK